MRSTSPITNSIPFFVSERRSRVIRRRVALPSHHPRVRRREGVKRRAVHEDDAMLLREHPAQPVRGDKAAGAAAEDEDGLAGQASSLFEPDQAVQTHHEARMLHHVADREHARPA